MRKRNLLRESELFNANLDHEREMNDLKNRLLWSYINVKQARESGEVVDFAKEQFAKRLTVGALLLPNVIKPGAILDIEEKFYSVIDSTDKDVVLMRYDEETGYDFVSVWPIDVIEQYLDHGKLSYFGRR